MAKDKVTDDDHEILFKSNKRKDPALLKAVLNVLPPDSKANIYLTRGTRIGQNQR